MDSRHRRVGAAAIAAFLALLLIGATHKPAQADPATPATTQPAAPNVEPFQPQHGFDHERDHAHDGFGPGGGGTAPAPAPGTGGSTT